MEKECPDWWGRREARHVACRHAEALLLSEFIELFGQGGPRLEGIRARELLLQTSQV